MSERRSRPSWSKRDKVRHRSRERTSRTRITRINSDGSRNRRSKDSTPGRTTPHRRSSASRNVGVLRRTASEPNLWQGGLHWEDEVCVEKEGKIKRKEKFLWRPQTLSDLLDRSHIVPSLPPITPLPCSFHNPEKPFAECDKFLVTVTVEGSTGPIKLIVRKSDTVADFIKLTIDKYAKEGRHPELDSDINMFELHLSNFSMESLKRSDRMIELGSRTFFLRQENRGEYEPVLFAHTPGPFFSSFIARRMKKISRKSRKFWKLLDCMVCG